MPSSDEEKQARRDYYAKNKKELNKITSVYRKKNRKKIALDHKHRNFLASLSKEADKIKRRVVVVRGGIEVQMFTPSEFANRIGRAVDTVRTWQLRKVTPPTIFEVPGNTRYFSEGEILVYVNALEESKGSLESFSQLVYNGVANLRKEYGLVD